MPFRFVSFRWVCAGRALVPRTRAARKIGFLYSAIVLSNFFLLFFCDNSTVKLSSLLLTTFILFKHSENIKRLLKKEELSFEGRDKN